MKAWWLDCVRGFCSEWLDMKKSTSLARLSKSLYQLEDLREISEDVRLCEFAGVVVYTTLRKIFLRGKEAFAMDAVLAMFAY
jgi:hypothetical protein